MATKQTKGHPVAPQQASDGTKEYSQEVQEEVTKLAKKGTVKVHIETGSYEDYQCCTRLLVSISLKAVDSAEYSEVGEMTAFILDKTLKPESGKSTTALWIVELLKQGDIEFEDEDVKDQTNGLRGLVNELYTKTGTVRAKLKQRNAELTTDRLVFIANFELSEGFRGGGAGVLPMTMFLGMLPEVLGTEGERTNVPCLLSPARSESAKIANGLSEVEVERRLIRTYQRNDFEVWLQGDEKKPGSYTATA